MFQNIIIIEAAHLEASRKKGMGESRQHTFNFSLKSKKTRDIFSKIAMESEIIHLLNILF